MARTPTILAASAAALLILGQWPSACVEKGLRADPVDPLADTDGDFLPDSVEWAVVTSSLRADTDHDGVPDFVEVVQNANPRRALTPLPQDHEMRVVVTSSAGPGGSQVWLHMLMRFMGDVSLMTSFRPWIQVAQLPGFRIPLDAMGSQTVVRQRVTQQEGLWVTVSVPLVSEDLLRMLLPATLGAEATIGGRGVRSVAKVFPQGATTATLVPFEDGFAVQSIGSAGFFRGGGSNKICVLSLSELGTGPAGTTYRVTDALCDDCNDLECGVGCEDTVGWVFVVPGGVQPITGG